MRHTFGHAVADRNALPQPPPVLKNKNYDLENMNTLHTFQEEKVIFTLFELPRCRNASRRSLLVRVIFKGTF